MRAEAEYEVKTKIVVADFSKGQSVYEHIERELKDIPVGILGTFFRISIMDTSIISVSCNGILFEERAT